MAHPVRTAEWQRLDIRGTEKFELVEIEQGWLLRGQVVLGSGDEEARVEYSVNTDQNWVTREVTVHFRRGDSSRQVRARADGRGRWRQDDREIAVARGCLDVDLAFTPSTNTLPIRRLKLDVGTSARVRAAWLRYPELDWQVLEQEYERLSEDTYEYRSRGGILVVKLKVDDVGLV